jgi:hypothetical protein
MDHKHLHHLAHTCAAASLLALAAVHASAAEPSVVWVDNESFGFTNCAPADALPGSQDPRELMNALRERGLADAGRMARARGFGEGTITLTPVSGSIRCEGSTSAVVFRVASHDGGLNGRAWSSNLVSRLPATGVPTSGLRSTR